VGCIPTSCGFNPANVLGVSSTENKQLKFNLFILVQIFNVKIFVSSSVSIFIFRRKLYNFTRVYQAVDEEYRIYIY